MLIIAAFLIVAICQVFIIIYWKDAKFWTILNLVALLFCVATYGRYTFNTMVRKEIKELFLNTNQLTTTIVTEKSIVHLPVIVQKWLRSSGVVDKENVYSVKLKQKGKMRTKPDGKWMPFTASQYFNIERTSFVWTAKIKAMPLLGMYGRDKLVNGEGAMLIKLAALISVVNEGENYQIDSGAMIRYLAEICWFPTAAIHPSIVWKTINVTSAKAIFTIGNIVVSGIFNFSEKGEIVSFEAERFYGGTKEATLEKWYIEMVSYKDFNGITIPNKSNVIWKLKEGDFHWLTLEITDIVYNTAKMY
jgi:Ca2+/Na+ antiporter